MIRLNFIVFALLCTPAMGMLTHNLNVELIQVCDDSGAAALCTPIGPTGVGDDAYYYQSQVQDIWAQAGIGITFTTSTWNNTEAQRLTATERGAIYGNTFTSLTGDALPAIGLDTVQIFFVQDHPGTGFNGTAGTGWVDNPLSNPSLMARNAGNAQLFIDGTFSSNGRSVMSNEGFAADSLSGTLAHEIGHLIGLRHIEDVNSGDGAGTTQDPNFTTSITTPNLMWGAGMGPAYNGALNDDSEATVLQENFALNALQIGAAIHNGLALDPDGNGTGVLVAVPEPGAIALMGIVSLFLMATTVTKHVTTYFSETRARGCARS